MDFPPDWEVFPAEEFPSAVPRITGELSMELLAQVRPNGRVLDHFRVSFGRSKILDISVPLSKLLVSSVQNSLKLKFQYWPRDILIKRNMTTSTWTDVYDLLESRNANVVSEDGAAVPHEAILRDLKDSDKSASIRFAVVIGEDMRMALMLQCLPASATHLMGKPALRG